MPSKKKTDETAKSESASDSRSEVLRLLDQVDTPTAKSLEAVRKIRRLIQRTWDHSDIPKRKVRIWWGPTDVLVHAQSPGDAMDIALTLNPEPTPIRITVYTENKDGAWDREADRVVDDR